MKVNKLILDYILQQFLTYCIKMRIYLTIISFMAVFFSSCDEVKDSPLLFEVTSNINPEYISIGYHTDEIGVTLYPKELRYFIHTYTYIDGELELTCTNCDHLDYSIDCTYGITEDNVGKDVSATEDEVGVAVNIKDHKTLQIHFDKLPPDEELPAGFDSASAIIKVYGRVEGKDVTTRISIYRSTCLWPIE